MRESCLLKFDFINHLIWFYLPRHSNFGGTYVMKNMKSTSERELIYHKPIRDESDITLLDKDKVCIHYFYFCLYLCHKSVEHVTIAF